MTAVSISHAHFWCNLVRDVRPVAIEADGDTLSLEFPDYFSQWVIGIGAVRDEQDVKLVPGEIFVLRRVHQLWLKQLVFYTPLILILGW